MTRSESRRQAFILVFQKEFNPEMNIEQMLMYSETNEYYRFSSFALKLAGYAFDEIENSDKIIKELLTASWGWDKISVTVKSALRLGIAELKHTDTDAPVIIKEVVSITSEYSDDDNAKFVHGILSNALKLIR